MKWSQTAVGFVMWANQVWQKSSGSLRFTSGNNVVTESEGFYWHKPDGLECYIGLPQTKNSRSTYILYCVILKCLSVSAPSRTPVRLIFEWVLYGTIPTGCVTVHSVLLQNNVSYICVSYTLAANCSCDIPNANSQGAFNFWWALLYYPLPLSSFLFWNHGRATTKRQSLAYLQVETGEYTTFVDLSKSHPKRLYLLAIVINYNNNKIK